LGRILDALVPIVSNLTLDDVGLLHDLGDGAVGVDDFFELSAHFSLIIFHILSSEAEASGLIVLPHRVFVREPCASYPDRHTSTMSMFGVRCGL